MTLAGTEILNDLLKFKGMEVKRFAEIQFT